MAGKQQRQQTIQKENKKKSNIKLAFSDSACKLLFFLPRQPTCSLKTKASICYRFLVIFAKLGYQIKTTIKIKQSKVADWP